MEEYKSEKNLLGLYQKALRYEKLLNDKSLEAILGETKRIDSADSCHGRVYGDYHNSCCKYTVA